MAWLLRAFGWFQVVETPGSYSRFFRTGTLFIRCLVLPQSMTTAARQTSVPRP